MARGEELGKTFSASFCVVYVVASGSVAKSVTGGREGIARLRAYVVRELPVSGPGLRHILPCSQTLTCYIIDNRPTGVRPVSIQKPKLLHGDTQLSYKLITIFLYGRCEI